MQMLLKGQSVWGMGTDEKEGADQLNPNVTACANEASGWHSVIIVGYINQHSRSEPEREQNTEEPCYYTEQEQVTMEEGGLPLYEKTCML